MIATVLHKQNPHEIITKGNNIDDFALQRQAMKRACTSLEIQTAQITQPTAAEAGRLAVYNCMEDPEFVRVKIPPDIIDLHQFL